MSVSVPRVYPPPPILLPVHAKGTKILFLHVVTPEFLCFIPYVVQVGSSVHSHTDSYLSISSKLTCYAPVQIEGMYSAYMYA